MDLEERRALYQGYGDTLARAVEFVLTPLLFGGAGWLLDRWVGTTPLFIVLFVALSLVGMGVKTYYAYEAQMRIEEEKLLGPRPWRPPT